MSAPSNPPANDQQERIRQTMAALWERNLPLIRDRLDELGRAAEAAATGSLDPAQRASAAGTAHKLAGSLGMFGYAQGTDLARELEQHLETAGEADPARLQELARSLRAALGF